jgi:hypothetical protein
MNRILEEMDSIDPDEAKNVLQQHRALWDFFERLIKPLPLQNCIGFLMGLNSLFEEDGKLLCKKPFKGKEANFYAIKGPKMESSND